MPTLSPTVRELNQRCKLLETEIAENPNPDKDYRELWIELAELYLSIGELRHNQYCLRHADPASVAPPPRQQDDSGGDGSYHLWQDRSDMK